MLAQLLLSRVVMYSIPVLVNGKTKTPDRQSQTDFSRCNNIWGGHRKRFQFVLTNSQTLDSASNSKNLTTAILLTKHQNGSVRHVRRELHMWWCCSAAATLWAATQYESFTWKNANEINYNDWRRNYCNIIIISVVSECNIQRIHPFCQRNPITFLSFAVWARVQKLCCVSPCFH